MGFFYLAAWHRITSEKFVSNTVHELSSFSFIALGSDALIPPNIYEIIFEELRSNEIKNSWCTSKKQNIQTHKLFLLISKFNSDFCVPTNVRFSILNLVSNSLLVFQLFLVNRRKKILVNSSNEANKCTFVANGR